MKTVLSKCDWKRVELSLITKIALAAVNKARGTCYNHLKPKQCQCLLALLSGDVLGVLPTGYGKSLIFELIPYMIQAQSKSADVGVILITPLNSIILEQVARYGQKAVHITNCFLDPEQKDSVSTVQQFREGNYIFCIGHPEHIITKSVFDVFKLMVWQQKEIFIVVDEAHCVIQWGSDFRKSFADIQQLRGIFTHAKMCALTATATTSMQETIKLQLKMPHACLVVGSIDRRNIYLEVVKRLPTTGSGHPVEESYSTIFAKLLMELQGKQEKFPKTIIYTKLKWCAYGHEMALRPTLDGKPSQITPFVAQYHKPCTQAMRQEVSSDLASRDSTIRLLFATEAYSMGTDAPGIRRVIHVGPPGCLETYLQEIGRAGRNKEPATATLYYNASDISSNVTGLKEEMKAYCTLATCRRLFLCQHFGCHFEPHKMKHNCCDICLANCDCTQCTADRDSECVLPIISEHKSTQILLLLKDYFDAEMSSGCKEAITDLNYEMATQIATNYVHFTTCESLTRVFNIEEQYAENILTIINSL